MVALPVSQPRAAIYVRVSSLKQKENASLETQEADCRRYAEERGYRVQAVYREVHTGAELWERPQLTALRAAVRAGDVHAVIAHDVDRLGREQAHQYIVADECERADCALLFVLEEFEQTAIGKFMRGAKTFAAEVEREKFRERSMRGMAARIKAGKLRPGARPLYGYRWRDETKAALVIDAGTAPIVRRIFAAIAGGKTLRAVADELNADHIPTPAGGKRWNHTTIRQIVSHPGYTGQAVGNQFRATKVPGKGWYRRSLRPVEEHVELPDGTIPPLVDETTAAAVRAALARNKTVAGRNNRDPEAFLLRAGHIQCGYCGRAIAAGWHRPAGKEPRPIYRSSRGDIGHPDCPSYSISAGILDAAVWRYVEKILTSKGFLAAQLARMRDNDPTPQNLDTVDRLLTEVRRKQTNLTRRLALVDDDDEAAPIVAELQQLAKRLGALQQERATIQAQQEQWRATEQRLEALADWSRVAAQVGENLADLPYEQRRELLLALGIVAKVYRKDHEPRWEITAAISPDGTTLVDTSA